MGVSLDESSLLSCLERIIASGVDAALVEGLGDFVGTSSDVEVFRVNPIRYADERGLDQSAVIDLFLQATTAGLFRMEWNIVCVSCGNVFKSFRALEEVDPHFHCTLCDMENQSRLDDVIQVVFTIDPVVREIVFHHPDELTLEQLLFDFHYSRAARTNVGDMATVDLLRDVTAALQYVEPAERAEFDVDLEEGTLLVRDWTTSIAFAVLRDEEKITRHFVLTFDDDGLGHPGIPTSKVPIETPIGTLLLPAVHAVGPGGIHLTCRNESSWRWPVWIVKYPSTFIAEVVANVENSGPLSAKRLLNTPLFRRLFRMEAPPEGEGLSVTDLTYLFTDLKDSTAMYDEIGDVTAYNLVRVHFDILDKAVSRHHGVLVKTIGDAVMATFLRPTHAVSAAIDMVDSIRNETAARERPMELKVGVHRGHSVAVTLNERLDYFGQNVNIAARTQQLAGASEILITQDILDAEGVGQLLAGYDVEPVSGAMKGVSEQIPVFRISNRQP